MILKGITLLLLLSLQLFARHYDDTLLDIGAKLFPKIAMLEKHIKEKESSTLSLVIFSRKSDRHIAEKLKARIVKNYPKKILNKKVYVEIKYPDSILEHKTDAIMVLYHSPKILLELASWTNRHTILTFTYDPSDLKYAMTTSLYLGKSTQPYLNRESIRKYNFSFDPYLMSISKYLR